MDPIGTVTAIISSINYLQDAVDQVKENSEQCKKFCAYASELLGVIKDECKNGIPETLYSRLKRLNRTLRNLVVTIKELSRSSIIKRIIWRGKVSERIQGAYVEVDHALQVIHLRVNIEILRFRHEHEQARQRDNEYVKSIFEHLLREKQNTLMFTELQITKEQSQEEALLCLTQYTHNLSHSPERAVLNNVINCIRGPNHSAQLQSETIPDHLRTTSSDVLVYRDRPLGTGGFVSVYEGDWNGTKVAVKVMRRDISRTAINKEIEVWAWLQHPNILQLLAACTVADPPFMVCTVKVNRDAMSYIKHNRSADRRKILHEACLGLVHLHIGMMSPVIHGDLKGANILVDEHGSACLADFGLSIIKINGGVSLPAGSKEKRGTVRWMSPEALRGDQPDEKADIYSFGMTIYEILSGKAPFKEITDERELVDAICKRDRRPSRPDDSNLCGKHGFDDETWSLLTEAWNKEPNKRPEAQVLSLRLAPTDSPQGHHRSHSQPSSQHPKTPTRDKVSTTSDSPSPMSKSSALPFSTQYHNKSDSRLASRNRSPSSKSDTQSIGYWLTPPPSPHGTPLTHSAQLCSNTSSLSNSAQTGLSHLSSLFIAPPFEHSAEHSVFASVDIPVDVEPPTRPSSPGHTSHHSRNISHERSISPHLLSVDMATAQASGESALSHCSAVRRGRSSAKRVDSGDQERGRSAIPDPLDSLRKLMRDEDLDYYVIPTEDNHRSVQVASCDRRREWISGFTGATGEASRQQLNINWHIVTTGATDGPQDWIEWLVNLVKGMPGQIGIDARTLSHEKSILITERLQAQGGGSKIKYFYKNLVDHVWKRRPSRSRCPISIRSGSENGAEAKTKLHKLRGWIESCAKPATADQVKPAGTLISNLASISYLLNLQGNDLPHAAVFYAYLFVSSTQAILFVSLDKIDDEVGKYLKRLNVECRDYDSIWKFLQERSRQRGEGKIIVSPQSSRAVTATLGRHRYIILPSVVELWCTESDT